MVKILENPNTYIPFTDEITSIPLSFAAHVPIIHYGILNNTVSYSYIYSNFIIYKTLGKHKLQNNDI